MCHMLFTLFIFRPLPAAFSFLFFPSFLLARILTYYTTVSLATFILSVLRPLFLFILPYFPPLLSSSPTSPLRSRCSTIFATLSLWLARRYFSILLLFSRSLNRSPSLFYSLPRWFSFPLCSRRSHLPCLPFRLLVYTLMTRSPLFSPSFVRHSLVFLARVSLLLFHVFTTVKGFFGLLCPCRFLFLTPVFDSFLLQAPFDPRRAILPSSFVPRTSLSLSLSLSYVPKIYSLGAGPVKNLNRP
jgi:hypothetical protein